MMVCFEVFYFEFTINLPPPTGGGLVQRFGGMFLLPISKHCPVKLQESLLNAETLKPALSRQ